MNDETSATTVADSIDQFGLGNWPIKDRDGNGQGKVVLADIGESVTVSGERE